MGGDEGSGHGDVVEKSFSNGKGHHVVEGGTRRENADPDRLFE
jgi:hypothetical protein